MSKKAWQERWDRPTQGFHQEEFNAQLVAHGEWLTGGSTVLVPLCGRTLDMDWLAERFERVIGVELIADPVRRFFEERGLTAERTTVGAFEAWTAGPFRLLVGDCLQLRPDDVGPIDAIYDRASLIALVPEARTALCDALTTVATADTRLLLITLEYDQTRTNGPPYAVLADEVRDRLDGWTLEAVERGIPSRLPPRFEGVPVERVVWQARRQPQ